MMNTVIPPEVESLLEAGRWETLPEIAAEGGMGWFRHGIRGSGVDCIWSYPDEDSWTASHMESATLKPNMIRSVDVEFRHRAKDGEKANDDGMSMESFPSLEDCLKGCDFFFKNPFEGRGSHIEYHPTC